MLDHRIEGVGEVDAEDLLALLDADNVHDVGPDEVGFCVDPSARVLTRDLRWIPAGELEAGQPIWGFDEEICWNELANGESVKDRRWRSAVVVAAERKQLPSSHIRLDDGTVIIASDDHRWLVGERLRDRRWVRTSDLKVDAGHLTSKIARLLPTWSPELSWEAGWLAGIMDGEACLTLRKGKNNYAIHIYQNQGPVLDEIRRVIDLFDFRSYEYGHKDHSASTISLRGGLREVAAFLGSIRPHRLLAKFDLDGKRLRVMEYRRVISVEPLGMREVVALQTSTKTFVCEGLASHNSCFYVPGHSHGDQNPSAHVNRDSLLWRCKGCGRSGNLLELVKLALPIGTTHPEALSWLREHFGEVVRKPRGGSLAADLQMRLDRTRVKTVERRLPGEAETIGPEGIFYVDWESDHDAAVYMRGRGFEPYTLHDWGFGYDTWSRRIAIPVRDERGILVGFKGRALDDRMIKYMLLGDVEGGRPRYGDGYGFEPYDHNAVLFGLDRVAGRQPFTLVEGELDAVACHAAGVPAVASGTKSVSKQQLWLMRAHTRSLVIFYDSDGPGQDAVWGFADDEAKWHPGLVEKISPHFTLYVVDDHEGDAASMDPQQRLEIVYGAKHWLRYALPSAASV
jgi:hypothetical protein